MKKLLYYLIVSFLLLQTTVSFSQKTNTGKTAGPEKGSLLIVGGGKVTPEIWTKFIELAGGSAANIVIIPTAGEDSSINSGISREKELLHDLGVSSVTVLHTRDVKIANTEKFVVPLRKATGIWFTGGRQWKIADAYFNTLAHREFNALLNRGGIIAGTSAGATIQGSFLLRGDTKGNTILVGDHIDGLGFLRNVAIDQHILRRNRQFDLIEVIKARPELLGIGIDESTAILVQKNIFQVLGNSYVAVYDIDQMNGHVKTEVGNYTTNAPFIFLGSGQRYDVSARKVINDPKVALNNNE